MAEILNRLPLAARWILMVAVLVLLVLLVALLVSQIQADADSARLTWLDELFGQATGQPCLRDAADFDQPNICRADDVELTVLELVAGPELCIPGERIEVKLAATLQSRSSARYDIGFYIAEDNGNALDRGTSCFRDFLHPTSADNQDLDLNGGLGPFYNGEIAQNDECGDIQQDASSYYYLNENQDITITCQDSDGNGVADVGTVISWDINRDTDCTDEGDAVPNETSKCRAGAINIAGLLVPQFANIELIKRLEPNEDPGLFNLYIADVAVAEGVSHLGTTGVVSVTAGTNAEPGETYLLSETAGADTALPDYAIVLDCVQRDTATSVGTTSGPGPHRLLVQPDDDLVCTFTNTRRQDGITIRKETDPALITGTFEFASSDTPTTFSLAHGEEQAFTGLTPLNTYSFTETVPIGWDLGQITCTGQVSSSVAYGVSDVSVTLAPEESVLCTFVDRPVPSIAVTKTVDPESIMEPGGQVTYTVQVENDSQAEVALDLTGLEDVPYGDLTDTTNQAISNTTCLTPTILPGESYTCTFQAAVAGSAGDLVTDTVTATALMSGGVEVQASDPATVSITAAPPILISVTKTVSPEVVYVPSGTVTYELGVTNHSQPGYDVRVSTLADDIYGDPTDTSNTEIFSSTCTLGEVLEPGDTYSCTFGAVVEGEVGFTVTDTFTATVMDRLQREASERAQASVTMVTEPPPTGGAFSAPILALGLAMMGTSLLLAGTATRLRKR